MIDEFTMERCRPYPELVEGSPEPYTIIDSQDLSWLPSRGLTDKVNHIICVPWHPLARDVSRHELAHVKWSPRKLPDFPFDNRVLQCVEDARINLGLARLGIPVDLDEDDVPELLEMVAMDAKQRERAMPILRAIASIGTNVETILLQSIAKRSWRQHRTAARLVDLVRKRLEQARPGDAPVAPVDAMIEIAGTVARELGLLEPNRDASGFVLIGGCCFGSGHGALSLPGAGLRAFSKLEGIGLAEALGSADSVRSGAMEISEPPLVHSVLGGNLRRGLWKAAEEGSVPRFLHRYMIDRKIYRRPARRRGGSVLIDTSASMALRATDLDRIVRQAASAALVAIYSGRADKGELRIVARDGVRADEKHLKPFGGSNVIDEPALEWLAKQPAPRVWLSDGNATGINDAPSPAISRRCRTICSRARIRRVADVGETIRALSGRLA